MEKLNITIFGDSISKGVYLDEKLQVKKLDNNVISLFSNDSDLSIKNYSVFGQTLERVYKKNLIDKYIDDIKNKENNTEQICVLCLGGNDADFNWKNVSENPLGFHSSKTDIKDFEIMLTDIITKLKSNNIDVIITTLFPINNERYFKNVLSKKYDGNAILTFLNNDLSNLNRHQELFNNKILEISYKMNCNLLDIRNVFLQKINFLEYLSLDGIHPNQKAQYLIYNFLKENFLKEKL